MALSRIPLPSFTFVLTPGPQFLPKYPTAIKVDSSPSLAMRPTARDHLMQTIDLRGGPDDNIQDPLNTPQTIDLRGEPNDNIQDPPNTSATRIDYGRIYLPTILEEEEPSTPPVVDKKQGTRTTKQYVLIFLQSLRRKLFSERGTAPVQLTTN